MNLGQEIQTVLVTGATGFIGGAVARRLRSENCMVRTLVRRSSDPAALTAAGWAVPDLQRRDRRRVGEAGLESIEPG